MVHDQLVDHAYAAAPAEAVGVLAGHGNVVVCALRLPNIAGRRAFFVDPRAQFEAERRIAVAGLELVGIYHSHPGGGPTMSPTDRAFAARWPVVHVVVAVGRPAGKADELRAFRPGVRDQEVRLTLG